MKILMVLLDGAGDHSYDETGCRAPLQAACLPNLVKLLTPDCPDETGGILNVETDAVKAVDIMMEHIEKNL